MAQTALSIRLDSEIKPQFDSICKEIGLSVNAAFNIFARAVVREGGIPFQVTTATDNRQERSHRAKEALLALQKESSQEEEWTDEQIDDLIKSYRKAK